LRDQAAALSALNDGKSAWIPMPFFHFGSDVYSRTPEERHMAWAMLMSWHSGMPMCASALSRTSMSESVQQLGRFNADNQRQLSGQGDTYLMRPLNEPALPFDEQNYWASSKELNAGAQIRAVVNAQSEPLQRKAVSWPESSIFSDQWNDIRMTRGNYFIAASCTPDSLAGGQRPVLLELSLASAEAWKLAFIQLIVQQKVGDELQWKVYQPLSGSSGFTSNGMKDVFPVVLDPSAGQLDVVFHYNGEWPVSFRCEEMNWLTNDASD